MHSLPKRGLSVILRHGIATLTGIIILISCTHPTSSATRRVFSPDSNIIVQFLLTDSLPAYGVLYNHQAVVNESHLGFKLQNSSADYTSFVFMGADSETFDEIWTPVWGAFKSIRNHYNQLTVHLRTATQPWRKIDVIFRVFNDGLGIRYHFLDDGSSGELAISDELTEFNFPRDYTAWWTPADFDSYEKLYNESSLSEVEDANTPLTMRSSEGVHISIHEADLTDFPGMTLRRTAETSFQSELVPWPNGVKAYITTPFDTPWRTIQITPTAGKLVESNLILNLNDPSVIKDTEWIQPGKYVGIWWGMHIGKWTWFRSPKHGANTKNAKAYIDFAGEHRIPYVLVEGWNRGWAGNWKRQDFTTPYPDYDLEELLRYARSKNVRILSHNETGGDAEYYETQIDTAFRMYEQLGIPGIKTGYAGSIRPRKQHHHGQWMVRHYQLMIEKAVEHQLMINAHEPIKPTGKRRTYPNFMTREGVRGMEYNAWSAGNPPEHTTILPFTRMLAGPLDYAPGIFDLHFNRYRKRNRVHTTLAKQLALYVILYSPLQMVSDLVENYEDQPALEFIEKVPTTWDTTIVLTGVIGDHITVVRKRGAEWFLGSITDEYSRELPIHLAFLDSGRYAAHLFADGQGAHWETNPYEITISQYAVSARDTLKLLLAAGGGTAIHFTPLPAGQRTVPPPERRQ